MTDPAPPSHFALIADLQRAFDAAVADLIPGESVALLDCPVSANVGDSAIWLGETRYLEKSGKAVRYCCTAANFDEAALRRAAGDAPILINGGGNFGDIWRHHHEFREHVIDRFGDRRVVQLPQSIHFRSEARADVTARIIEKHADFVLLVRDQPSLEFARRKFQCEVRLAPDAAFNIGPLQPTSWVTDVLALLRTDQEGLATRGSESHLVVEDWLDESRLRSRAAAIIGLANGAARGGSQARLSRYNAVARARLHRGAAQLSRGRVIITDRLHGHIISMLLGRHQALLDNEYGKIGRFVDAFTGESDLIYRASSIAEAAEWAFATARRLPSTERIAA